MNLNQSENNDAIRLLKDELAFRKKRNERYSLRAFAQSLNISPAQLSQLLSGKRNFTAAILTQISRSLHLSPEEEKSLHTQALIPHHILEGSGENNKRLLKDDEFRVISDWYHFAILSLCKIRKATADPYWISSRLGISVSEAKEALDRLQRLNIIEKSKLLKRKSAPLSVISETPSRAIQAYHSKILSMALDKISTVPIEKRDYSAMTLLADPKKFQLQGKWSRSFKIGLQIFCKHLMPIKYLWFLAKFSL